MKKYILLLVALCSLFSACIQEKLVPTEVMQDGFHAETECFGEDTKTALDQNNSVVWSKGDQIAIFQGSSIADLFEIASSSVGKTAGTFREVAVGSDGFVSGNEIETNIAVYPYSEDLVCSNNTVSEEDEVVSYKIENVTFSSQQTYQASSFPDKAFVMAAVTENVSDKHLMFMNVSGALGFRIRGDVKLKSISVVGNSSERIAGNATVVVYPDGRTAPVVSLNTDATRTVTLDCGSGVQLRNSSATEFIMALPPTIFEKGFTVTITDVNGNKDVRKTGRTNVVNRSRILNMPEIVFGEGDLKAADCQDISGDGSANSYIISAPGSYCFPAVKGNSSTSVGRVASVEVLWESFGTDVIPSKGDLVSAVAYESGNILLRTSPTFREGNAVIAAKDNDGIILWSWHIWLTDKPEDHVYRNGAGTMMDRNLGATSAEPGSVESLGLLYQWGRKDPFLNSSDINDYMIAQSTLEWPAAVDVSSSTGTVNYVTANPTVLVNGNDASSYDWMIRKDDGLWGYGKTIYDPCPPGWCIPDYDIWSTSGIEGVYDETLRGIRYYIFRPDATWYPASYIRDDGLLEGHYWTNTVSGDLSFNMKFYETEDGVIMDIYTANRHSANSVRCYKVDSSEPLPPSMINATDLNADGETANCYIVSKAGNYMFRPVKGNSTAPVGEVASVEVLWETFNTATTPSVGDLIKSYAYYDGMISFSTSDNFREGNAVIAAKDVYGNIIWSWHIWLTDKPSEITYKGSAGIMMDRNLGALSAEKGSSQALGLLYQWGRKDPFLGSYKTIGGSDNDDTQFTAKSTLKWPADVNSTKSVGTLDYVVAHPTTFIKGNQYTSNDWLYFNRVDTLWRSPVASKTIYDPCPAGWRVPSGGTSGPWYKAGIKDMPYDFDSSRGVVFSRTYANVDTWYPLCGNRVPNGYLMDVGSRGTYWSDSVIDSRAYIFYMYKDYSGSTSDGYIDPYTQAYGRSYGASVRCTKD